VIVAALVLFGIGLGDLVAAGLAGLPPTRVTAATITATVASLGLAVLAGLDIGTAVLIAALTGVTETAWCWARGGGALTIRRVWLALGVVPLGLAIALLAGGAVVAPDQSALTRALAGVPAVARGGVTVTVAVIGGLVAQLATANAMVRLVVAAAGPGIARGGDRLQGGRLIGAMERLLILGLAAAGEPTAAAIVVGAKAILRFPELAAAARRPELQKTVGVGSDALDRVDAVTEYFLIGSLASWLIALAPIALR
jgi:hypothetical protein